MAKNPIPVGPYYSLELSAKRKKKKPFRFYFASNLTHDYFYYKLNKEIKQNEIRRSEAKVLVNTFAPQCLIFEEKNEPFFIKKASNLTHEFLYDNFNKKILLNKLNFEKNFLKKCVT